MIKKRGKKAQVTIFVILAIAIVIVLILLFSGRAGFTFNLIGKTPVEQIRDCMKEPVKQGIDVLSSQGGLITPENYYMYKGNKIDYLCYTEEYSKKCVMQRPLLKQSIENELEKFSKNKIETCIESVKSSLEKDGYSVSSKKPEISVELVPNNILISLNNLDLIIEKGGTETYSSIKTDLDSVLYRLVMIASSISNWEARFGDTETINYMMYYPSLKVEKKEQSDGATVYILTDKNSLEEFIFAVRSFVIPTGITGN